MEVRFGTKIHIGLALQNINGRLGFLRKDVVKGKILKVNRAKAITNRMNF